MSIDSMPPTPSGRDLVLFGLDLSDRLPVALREHFAGAYLQLGDGRLACGAPSAAEEFYAKAREFEPRIQIGEGRRALVRASDPRRARSAVVGGLVEALRHLDLRSAPWLLLVTVRRLAAVVCAGPAIDHDLAAVLRELHSVKQHDRVRRDSLLAAHLAALRGMILARFAAVRRAAPLLERARQELLRRKDALAAARVALELGEIYRDDGRWPELRRIAVDAVFRFRSAFGLEARAALLVWRDAILNEDLDDDIVNFARRRLTRLTAGVW